MATTTTNLGLVKPDGTDKVLILVLNGNFDKIDAAIGAIRAQQIPAEVITAAVEEYLAGVDIAGGATPEQVAQIDANKTNIETLTNKVNNLKASDVGARPDTWVPSASEVGALPSSYTAPVTKVNGKTGDITLSATDVGARPNSWMPSASDVGALPSTYTPPVKSVNGQTGAVNIPLPKMAILQYDAPWDDAQNAVRIPVSAFVNPASTTDASKLCFMTQVYGRNCIISNSFVSGGNLYIRL